MKIKPYCKSFIKILIAIYLFPIEITGQGQDRIATHHLQVLAETPIQFGIGYNLQIGSRLSAGIQSGLLSPPNSSLILFTLGQLGTDETVILMIEDAFRSGFVVEGNFNYHFGKNYAGVFTQGINLVGKNTPRELVENALGIDIPDSPRFPGRTTGEDRLLTLESSLLQAGLLYGRRIPIKNSRSELRVEFAVSKNLSSRSSISSPNRDFSVINQRVDSYLSGIYNDYAIIPSFSFIYVLRLGNIEKLLN